MPLGLGFGFYATQTERPSLWLPFDDPSTVTLADAMARTVSSLHNQIAEDQLTAMIPWNVGVDLGVWNNTLLGLGGITTNGGYGAAGAISTTYNVNRALGKTVFVVYRRLKIGAAPTSANQAIIGKSEFSGAAGRWHIIDRWSAEITAAEWPDATRIGGTIPGAEDALHLATTSWEYGGIARFFVNNVEQGNVNRGTALYNNNFRMGVGRIELNTLVEDSIQIGEVQVYNSYVSPAGRTAIGARLMAKWGITP